MPGNCIRCEETFVRHNSDVFDGHCQMSGANIQASPIHLKLIRFTYFTVIVLGDFRRSFLASTIQRLAVNTQYGDIIEPPQTVRPCSCNPTCQGKAPCFAVLPPITRLVYTDGRPQSK